MVMVSSCLPSGCEIRLILLSGSTAFLSVKVGEHKVIQDPTPGHNLRVMQGPLTIPVGKRVV